MGKDQRLYGKFCLTFPNHQKIVILSDAAFRCLVEATLWSRDQQTDGFLARRLAVAKWSLEALQELCTNDDEKPSLIEREEGWYIHDYSEHQDTKADIEARRQRNRLAGQQGGLAKAKRSAKRPAKRPASEVVSENVAEKEKGVAADFPATEPAIRCPNHLNHTDPPPCNRCKEARKANESWHASALDRKRAERAALKAISDSCPICQGTNWIPDTEPAVKCNHEEAVNG